MSKIPHAIHALARLREKGKFRTWKRKFVYGWAPFDFIGCTPTSAVKKSPHPPLRPEDGNSVKGPCAIFIASWRGRFFLRFTAQHSGHLWDMTGPQPEIPLGYFRPNCLAPPLSFPVRSLYTLKDLKVSCGTASCI